MINRTLNNLMDHTPSTFEQVELEKTWQDVKIEPETFAELDLDNETKGGSK